MKSLKVPGKLESLGMLRQFVRTAAQAAGIPLKAAHALQLAIDEIATNVVTHGYQEVGLEGDMLLTAEIDGQRLTMTLEDTGCSYNPGEVGQPDSLDSPLEERPIGGLGVFLAIRNVDDFRYERAGNRNRHTFVVYRPAAAP